MGVGGARHVLLSVVGVGEVRHVIVRCWSSCGQECPISAVAVGEVRHVIVSSGSR